MNCSRINFLIFRYLFLVIQLFLSPSACFEDLLLFHSIDAFLRRIFFSILSNARKVFQYSWVFQSLSHRFEFAHDWLFLMIGLLSQNFLFFQDLEFYTTTPYLFFLNLLFFFRAIWFEIDTLKYQHLLQLIYTLL